MCVCSYVSDINTWQPLQAVAIVTVGSATVWEVNVAHYHSLLTESVCLCI